VSPGMAPWNFDGPTFRRGLTGDPCKVCGERLPVDDERYLNLWVHKCTGESSDRFDRTDSDPKPINFNDPNWFRFRNYRRGEGLADTEKEEHPKHERGLSDSEIREFFKRLEIDPDNRAGLPENILLWLKKWDEVIARNRQLTKTLSEMTELEQWQYLGLPDRPINWTHNANPAPAWTWIPTSKELKTIGSKVGKRGGVLCRSCYRAMEFSALNGGYDWHCGRCGIVWRFRYGTA